MDTIIAGSFGYLSTIPFPGRLAQVSAESFVNWNWDSEEYSDDPVLYCETWHPYYLGF